MVETVEATLPGSPHHRQKECIPMSASHNSTRKRDSMGRLLPVPAHDRFWMKVQKTDTCWLWTAACNQGGYGRFLCDGKLVQAHRWAYEQVKGPIPEGLDLDHLCRVRNCVNPNHLEPVTRRQNLMRGEHTYAKLHRAGHCKRGHPFNKQNTYICKQGKRHCRICNYENARRQRHMKAQGVS